MSVSLEQFNNAFDPSKNGAADAFNPNNNGFIYKTDVGIEIILVVVGVVDWFYL